MQTVLITGGSRGIGAEMVRLFCRKGWQVIFTYHTSEEKAYALSRETGAQAIRWDAASESDTAALALEVNKRFPFLDALICNAGISYTGLVQDMTLQQWNTLFSVNVGGAFLATRAFLPGMISRQAGSIVYVSSMWGQVGASCEVAYSASKAALIGLAKALAKEVGPSQVRVNCLCPGVIETEMLKQYTKEELSALAEETPLQRLGTPRDVAQSALFLCSGDAGFLTGQVLGVSGGFVI